MSASKAGHWLAPLLLGLLSLLLYSINLDRLPHNDELYHMLAAQGLLATGEPTIGEDGRYWRGYLVTWLAAQSIEQFGPTLAAGRLPSIVFMAAMVAALFVFLRRETDALTAWLGAGLFAVSPFAVDMAQFVRFYSLQCLVFFSAAWLTWLAVSRPWALPWRGLAAALAAALLGFGVYLQPTTLLGIGGLGLWTVGVLAIPRLLSPARSPRQQVMLVLAMLVAAGVAVGGLAMTGILVEIWTDFRNTALFAEGTADHFWFYHSWYLLLYPTLWSLVGGFAILALLHRPLLASFLLVVFTTGFVLNSLAGPKSLRYIMYAQPFLFALWGIGLARLIDLAGAGFVRRVQWQLVDRFSALPTAWAAGTAKAIVLAAIFFTIAANPAWVRSITLIADIPVPPGRHSTDWPAAQPALQPWFDRVEVVVVADEVAPLFFYGRADVMLNDSKFAELSGAPPFTPDFRTDVPSIPDAASFERLVDCHASGLFLIEEKFWGIDAILRDRTVEALVVARMTPVALPVESRLLAFSWTTAVDPERRDACTDLPTVGKR